MSSVNRWCTVIFGACLLALGWASLMTFPDKPPVDWMKVLVSVATAAGGLALASAALFNDD